MKNSASNLEFRKDVGFYDLPPANDSSGIVFNWDDLLNRVPAIRRNWNDIEETPLEVTPGVVSRSWMLMDGDKRASIEVCVATNASAAREKVIQLTSQTMALKSPFERMKTDLGEFALGNLNSEYEKMVWCRANVVVITYVQPISFHEHAMGVAHEIDRLMKESYVVDLSASIPPLPSLSPTKTVLHIGDKVEFVPGHLSDETELVLVDPSMAFSEQGPLTFVAEREGVHKVFAIVVNRRTLLHRQKEISLEVLPPHRQ